MQSGSKRLDGGGHHRLADEFAQGCGRLDDPAVGGALPRLVREKGYRLPA